MLGKFKLNNIYNEDSFEVIKNLPDKCIDLILTDPPYGIDMANGIPLGKAKNLQTRKQYKGDWDNGIPSQDFFNEMARVSKLMIVFGGNYFAHILPQSTHWLVWDKTGSLDFSKSTFSDCELVYTNHKRQSVVKYVNVQQGFINDGDERFHPTQKPLRLMTEILKDYSSENDLVVDFFSGSGTTAVACKDLGRKFVAFEKDENFYKKSLLRLNGITQTGQTSIFTEL